MLWGNRLRLGSHWRNIHRFGSNLNRSGFVTSGVDSFRGGSTANHLIWWPAQFQGFCNCFLGCRWMLTDPGGRPTQRAASLWRSFLSPGVLFVPVFPCESDHFLFFDCYQQIQLVWVIFNEVQLFSVCIVLRVPIQLFNCYSPINDTIHCLDKLANESKRTICSGSSVVLKSK